MSLLTARLRMLRLGLLEICQNISYHTMKRQADKGRLKWKSKDHVRLVIQLIHSARILQAKRWEGF